MNLNAIPMGPALRGWLGISECSYEGENQTDPGPETWAWFEDRLGQHAGDTPPPGSGELVDIIEELVGMRLPTSVVNIHNKFKDLFPPDNFRVCQSMGAAHMLLGEHSKAGEFFDVATELEPGETAPWVNLAEICWALGEDDAAEEYCQSGLKTDPNHHRLLEILASVFLAEDRDGAGENIRAMGRRLRSWAGLSLAAELIDPADHLLKSQILREAWDWGERDPEFLTEYSAALGLAREYEKLKDIVAVGTKGSNPPWRLYAHGIQGLLAEEKLDDARKLLDEAGEKTDLPGEVKEELFRLYDAEAPPSP